MTGVGLAGIALGFLAWPIAVKRPNVGRALLFLSLLTLHIASSVVYYSYVQYTSADSKLYFFDDYGLHLMNFGFGTIFTVKIVQFLKGLIGGTYLDYFLLFQSIGFFGIIILVRVFDEVHSHLRAKPVPASYLLLFLPGVHFWTSAIGKDAPLFFSVSLAVWAALRLPRRLPYFTVALCIMVLFRPHIALITAAAYALAEFMEPKSTFFRKAVLLTIAVAGLTAIAGTVRSTLDVDVTSVSSLGDFLERQQSMGRQIGGSTAVLNAPFIIRLLSLLFRPLFFDAGGAFGLISSVENLIYLFIILTFVMNFRLVISLFRRVFILRFSLLLAVTITVLLAVVYYNVGLGVRQKVMIVPPLFTFFVALSTVRRTRFMPSHPGGKSVASSSTPDMAAA